MAYSIKRSTRNTQLFVVVDSTTNMETKTEFPFKEAHAVFYALKNRTKSKLRAWIHHPKQQTKQEGADLRAQQQVEAYGRDIF